MNLTRRIRVPCGFTILLALTLSHLACGPAGKPEEKVDAPESGAAGIRDDTAGSTTSTESGDDESGADAVEGGSEIASRAACPCWEEDLNSLADSVFSMCEVFTRGGRLIAGSDGQSPRGVFAFSYSDGVQFQCGSCLPPDCFDAREEKEISEAEFSSCLEDVNARCLRLGL